MQTETAPTTNAPKKGLKKISFAKAPKKEESTTKYPVFADPENPKLAEQVSEIAARIKTRDGEIEALEGAQKTDKAELKMFVAPFYFAANRLKADPPSSVAINSDAGEVLVTFQNRYAKLTSEAAVEAILGDKVGDYFRQTFKLNINGEELPVGKEQEIVDDITAVLQKHGALTALEVKEEIKPTKDFHLQRHSHFTVEQNLQLEAACPITAMVKTKGRGK